MMFQNFVIALALETNYQRSLERHPKLWRGYDRRYWFGHVDYRDHWWGR